MAEIATPDIGNWDKIEISQNSKQEPQLDIKTYLPPSSLHTMTPEEMNRVVDRLRANVDALKAKFPGIRGI